MTAGQSQDLFARAAGTFLDGLHLCPDFLCTFLCCRLEWSIIIQVFDARLGLPQLSREALKLVGVLVVVLIGVVIVEVDLLRHVLAALRGLQLPLKAFDGFALLRHCLINLRLFFLPGIAVFSKLPCCDATFAPCCRLNPRLGSTSTSALANSLRSAGSSARRLAANTAGVAVPEVEVAARGGAEPVVVHRSTFPTSTLAIALASPGSSHAATVVALELPPRPVEGDESTRTLTVAALAAVPRWLRRARRGAEGEEWSAGPLTGVADSPTKLRACLPRWRRSKDGPARKEKPPNTPAHGWAKQL